MDKFLVLSAFFIFVRLAVIPMWMFIVIGFREIYVTVLRFIAMRRMSVLAAEPLGKAKTVAQLAVIGMILLFLLLVEMNVIDFGHRIWIAGIFLAMLGVVAITVVSGLQNIRNNREVYFVRKNG